MNKREQGMVLNKLAGMGELFGKDLSPSILSLYLDILDRYSLEDVTRGLNKCSLTLKYFPKPSEIISAIEGNPEELALAAWTSVENAVRSVGRYGKVSFEDGRIYRIVRSMGGWEHVCSWKESDLDYRRQEFMKLYSAMEDTDGANLVLSSPVSSGEVVKISMESRKSDKLSLPDHRNTV